MKLLLLLAALDVSPLPQIGFDGNNLFARIIQFFFGLLAAISFITIVFGGFRYVISRGEPANVAKAKDTILYALIGLVVSFSAFGITNFLLKVFGS